MEESSAGPVNDQTFPSTPADGSLRVGERGRAFMRQMSVEIHDHYENLVSD